MSLDRDSLVPVQPRWWDPLVSIRSLEATLRTTHACPLVAPERNGPDRYTHRPDIRRPPAQEFLPVALRWRNWRRSARKNQSADEREIVPGRSFCIRLATTNSENLGPGKTGARYSLRRAEWSSAIAQDCASSRTAGLIHGGTSSASRRSPCVNSFPAVPRDETTSYRRAFRIV